MPDRSAATAQLVASVVFPEPPFWVTKVMVLMVSAYDVASRHCNTRMPLSSGEWAIAFDGNMEAGTLIAKPYPRILVTACTRMPFLGPRGKAACM